MHKKSSILKIFLTTQGDNKRAFNNFLSQEKYVCSKFLIETMHLLGEFLQSQLSRYQSNIKIIIFNFVKLMIRFNSNACRLQSGHTYLNKPVANKPVAFSCRFVEVRMTL